jgi:glycosyltransferase involved in cell wall biosynthesis
MLLGETGAGVLTAADPESVAQGILRVLGDPELAARLSLATRDVAREYFCMNRNIDRYLDVYDLALALPRR